MNSINNMICSCSCFNFFPEEPIFGAVSESVQTPFMPEWPEWISPQMVYTDRSLFPYTDLHIEQMEKILGYLADDNQSIAPPRMRSYDVTCPNQCIERLSRLSCKFILNLPQTMKDTFCCFCVGQSDPVPQERVWVPMSSWTQLMQNQRDVSRDTACLVCFAPAMTCFVPFIPPNYLLTVGLNLVLLYAAGIQTFLLVDYGSGELQAAKISTTGFKHLAKYIEKKWEISDDVQRAELKCLLEKVYKNLPSLQTAMLNVGLLQESIDEALWDFVVIVNSIVNQPRTPSLKHLIALQAQIMCQRY